MVEFSQTMKVWWYITWRMVVILFAFGFVFGLGGGNPQAAGVLGQLISIPLGIWMLHLSLNRFFGDKKD